MSFFDDKAATINALVDAVVAIETELGILPAGAYATVRTRLDILEARINNPLAPAPNVLNPFFIGNTGVSLQTSSGDPNILDVLAVPGSLYLRQDGYNDQGLYAFRPDGYWHQIDTDPWTANGDLAGTIYHQTVIGIQGRPVSSAAPQTDAEGDGYVLTWNSISSQWEPQIGFFAAGDLFGNKLSQAVINLQGNKLSVASPSNSSVITWNNVASQWEPQQPAVIFDPTNTPSATNIRSNRLTTQSPINNSQVGIVNLSSRSTGSTTGVTASYSGILSGDQNQVSVSSSVIAGGVSNIVGGSGNFIFLGGGSQNTVTGNRSSLVGGFGNTVSDINSFVGGGNANSISSTGGNNSLSGGNQNNITGNSAQSFLGSGNINSISSALQGLIGTGANNTVAGNNSTILNGIGNAISVSAFHSIILGGTGNVINDGYDAILGLNNTVASGTNKYVTIFGDFNTANANSHYSSIWGNNNTTADGYTSVFGDHNTISSGAPYANIHGRTNIVASPYTNICGLNNNINSGSDYSAIFGTNNLIVSNSLNSFAVGNNNVIIGLYNSTWGTSNSISSNSNGYNNTWGSLNAISADWANVFGYRHTVGGNADGYQANFSFVHGAYGKATNIGQYTHSSNNFGGVSEGVAQFSRMIVNGSSLSGGSMHLTLDGYNNIVTENGKCYDMEVRILVTDVTNHGACARYVFGVLAHNEGGLSIDRLDAILLNDNGTGWVGNSWSSGLITASGNELVINVPSSGSDSRRAMATIEWRELTRL